MHLVMDEEVKSLAGERSQQHEQRRAHRWGKENGYCVRSERPGNGSRRRTRLRSPDNREQRLGSYELFLSDGALGARHVGKSDAGGCGRATTARWWKNSQSAYGIAKSAVSQDFIEASRARR